ncbi:MAG: hypothetical protein KDD47_11945, partial [Acidobacteria bacterium]|nr:hypothetical protein [Acidobacteriota bacterium]
EQFAFFHHGPETSRRARALPAVLGLLCYGTERLGRIVERHVRLAEYLASRIREERDLELLAEPQLSILCFRYRPPGVDDATIDRVNREIRDALQSRGDFYLSETYLDGRPVLRVAILSRATRAHHLDALVDAVLHEGRSALT